jgi:transposase
MSEKKKYRSFTPEQEAEIVLAGLRGDRTDRDVCREYEIAETLYYQWRDRLLEGGKAALSTSRDRGKDPRDAELSEARKRVAQLERALGRKTYELEIAGNSCGTGSDSACRPGPQVGRRELLARCGGTRR